LKHFAVIHALADCLRATEPAVEPIVVRGAKILGKRWRWLRPLARRYLTAVWGRRRPTHREAVWFIQDDRGFRRACTLYGPLLTVAPPEAPASGPWNTPAVGSAEELAASLELELGELEWFADLAELGYKTQNPRLQHYHYRIVSNRFGSVRLIEAPKPRLKEIQRRILRGILEQIPAHPAAHGFVKGRSIRTFAAPHVSQAVILRMDLQDFFPSISAARIRGLFRTIGYPDEVAGLLGGICTNSVPRRAWSEPPPYVNRTQWDEARELYRERHLPQGAATSPALANLCAWRSDCRLAGFAKSAGAVYTRYADDLAFSGGDDFARRVERFSIYAAAILTEEGFRVHHRKSRIMRQGVRQHLAGVVANRHLNVLRPDFDRLKATLTNCVRHGPESQNRDGHRSFRSHLEGRIAFVESINPARGNRLREIFERINWS
jgi:hypothetical protein